MAGVETGQIPLVAGRVLLYNACTVDEIGDQGRLRHSAAVVFIGEVGVLGNGATTANCCC